MLQDIGFASALRSQLQTATFGSLTALAGGISISVAAITLGISQDLITKAISSLGLKRKTLSEDEIEKIKDWVKALPIDTELDEHVMKEKHLFNEKCGKDCILQVANNLKIYATWFAEGGIPIVRGTGNCMHDCLIEVRMSIPLNHTSWSIGTAFHKNPCNVGGGKRI